MRHWRSVILFPGDPYDSITGVEFTSTPEPMSYGLTAAGMLTMLAFTAFRLPHSRSWENRA